MGLRKSWRNKRHLFLALLLSGAFLFGNPMALNPPIAPVDSNGVPYVNPVNANGPVSSSNPLPVAPAGPDFASAAAAGLVPGASVAYAVGHVASVAMATPPIDICEQGTIYPFLDAASILHIVSASANDNSAGTGCQQLVIEGLDASYNPITEVVIPNGTTPVATVNEYLRINRASSAQAGSGKSNAGDITITAVSNSSVQGIIRAGIGDNQQAVYTIPAGFTGVLNAAQFSMGGQITTAFGQAALVANTAGPTSYNVGTRVDLIAGFPYNEASLIGFTLPPQTDVTARVLSVGQDNTQVSASFSILLLDQSVFNI